MRLNLLVVIVLILTVIACQDDRPDVPEAKQVFMNLYPGVEITSVNIVEDEVVARSFMFIYRKPGSVEKVIKIQFMRNDKTGQWEPRPAPPTELP